MSKAFIFLDKYSDYLEASNIFDYDKNINSCDVYYIENSRNDLNSCKDSFYSIEKKGIHINYFSCQRNADFSKILSNISKDIKATDFVIGPFVRYRSLWDQCNKIKTSSVQLSEGFPDSFGPFYYRLAFRLKSEISILEKIKTVIKIPPYYLYARINRLNICFYPFNGALQNKFVKKTISAKLPELSDWKIDFFNKYLQGGKRTLLISGFGYDVEKMKSFYGIDRYVATSKYKELIVDGNKIPIDNRICAEEVLLSGKIDRIIGYNSTVMIWAKQYFPEVEVICYESKMLNNMYGPLYGYLCKKSLKKIGVCILPENKKLLE